METPASYVYPLAIAGSVSYWKRKPSFVLSTEHSLHWTLFAIEDGQVSYCIGDVEGEAKGGDIVICPPGMPFQRKMIEPLSFFYVHFQWEAIEKGEEERIVYLLKHLFGYTYRTTEQDRLYNNFRHLLGVYHQKDAASRRWTHHFVNDLWSLFCMEAEALAQYGNIVHDPLMREAKEWIERLAFEGVQLKEIADRLELHPVQLSRRFTAVFGVTPSRYLFSIRMEKAKSLLIQTDYTMDHLAQLCGYDNGLYFSRMFTRYTKMNPSTYRRIHSVPSP